MDIIPTLPNRLLTANPVNTILANLKINQTLLVKVIQTDLLKNTLSLVFNTQTPPLNAQLNLPKNTPLPTLGANLVLKVISLQPTPTFQIIDPDNPAVSNTTPPLTLSLSLPVMQSKPDTAQTDLHAAATLNQPRLSTAETPPSVGVNAAKSPTLTLPLKNSAPSTPQQDPALMNTAERQQSVLVSTLRQLLPQQTNTTAKVSALLSNIVALQDDPQVPPELKTALQRLLQPLPQALSLTQPQLLQQGFKDAGIFLEAKLAQTMNPSNTQELAKTLQQDFKANLLRVLGVINAQLPTATDATLAPETSAVLTELRDNANSILNHILLDQLASVPKTDDPKTSWSLELPFITPQGIDQLKLEIEQEAETERDNESQTEPSWSVTVTLTPPGLGTLHCKISAIDGKLNTYFRSEDQPTLDVIIQQLDALKTRFDAAGLSSGHLDAQKGTLHKKLTKKIKQQRLFDDKA